jgi:cellulose synthase/poly-beta-1,6-N-acetylglucosamine synthase-like glycosyltransferase
VLGNLRIAEDRVLSYSVVLKSDAPSEMGLVPQAVFYFEAETNLKSLVLQRRYLLSLYFGILLLANYWS